MVRFAAPLLVVCVLVTAFTSGPADGRAVAADGPREEQALDGCGDCRVTFIKCLVAGKDLPAEARRDHNERCAAAASRCYKTCLQ